MLTIIALLAAASEPTLHTVSRILYSRHGIRVPYAPDPRGVQIFSTAPDANWYPNASDWGAAGEAHLTEHGESVVQRMGQYFKTTLVDTGYLPADGTKLTVYADNDPTQRDILTAKSFMSGLLPGVDVPIHSNATEVANMFNQGGAPGGGNPACVGPTEVQVEGELGGNGRAISVANAQAISARSDAISCCQPAVCDPTDPTSKARCNLMGMPTTWAGKFYLFYTGPFFTAATLTEYLQLMCVGEVGLVIRRGSLMAAGAFPTGTSTT